MPAAPSEVEQLSNRAEMSPLARSMQRDCNEALEADRRYRNALSAAMVGNTNARRGKLFRGALDRAISRDDGRRLNLAAEQLLTCAAEGQPWAIGMLADRLDGAPKQNVEIEAGPTLLDMLTQVAKARAGRVVQPAPERELNPVVAVQEPKK